MPDCDDKGAKETSESILLVSYYLKTWKEIKMGKITIVFAGENVFKINIFHSMLFLTQIVPIRRSDAPFKENVGISRFVWQAGKPTC